jgi:hypothetical protein
MKFKGVCFDERRDLVSYVESGIIEEDHIGRTIYKRARYNYFIIPILTVLASDIQIKKVKGD